MSLAWTCCAHPVEHGAFFQRGIDLLQDNHPEYRRKLGEKMYRRACPKCCLEHKAGHVRPATHDETLALIAASRRVA
jgi:hypothetical protein